MWGCFLMSGVKILHFLKDWWKSIPIHQNYTMALKPWYGIGPMVVNELSLFFSAADIRKQRLQTLLKGR